MKGQERIFEKPKKNSKYYFVIIFLILGFFILGFFIGEKIWNSNFDTSENDSYQLRNKENFSFINPLLDCDFFKKSNFIKYAPLWEKLEKVFNTIQNDSQIEHISIYFRDLNNWPWFGFNEKEEFTPASLLKVPLMMSYFKKAETDPNFLNKKIVFNINDDEIRMIQNIKPKIELKNGQEYTINEIIEQMIRYSDNKANLFLLENIEENYLNIVYTDLNIEKPNLAKTENFMTVKEYASFFNILYNASYLNKELSEKALNLLSQIDFKNGIVAWVPWNIIVSHKFWERITNDMHQLHDCGIIYYPNNPYLLCIMGRGNNFETIEKTIAGISKIVFDEIENAN